MKRPKKFIEMNKQIKRGFMVGFLLVKSDIKKVVQKFKSKKNKKAIFLMEEYNSGRVLRVDDGTDNKKYLLGTEVKDGKIPKKV